MQYAGWVPKYADWAPKYAGWAPRLRNQSRCKFRKSGFGGGGGSLRTDVCRLLLVLNPYASARMLRGVGCKMTFYTIIMLKLTWFKAYIYIYISIGKKLWKLTPPLLRSSDCHSGVCNCLHTT